ncbi:hypothetical protein ACFWVM_02345 [Nocardia fluminea]|uniref:hypothetical protein n=1 Tax=Nocardia fluminea TaxID=134984 RepID=UPI003647696F
MTRIKYLGAAIATLALAVGIPAVTAAPAMAANQKCMDFSTPTVGGKTASVNVCWNWVSNGQGAYDGRVWGKFYDPYTNNGKIYLQARVEPDRWVSFVSAGTETANGKSFNKPYTNIKSLAFKACLTGHGCR